MTRDEQRQAWRVYAAAVVAACPAHTVSEIAEGVDRLLAEERKRFDGPDHSGDANKMVESRPFAILTEDDIAETRSGAAKASLWFDGSTTPRIQTEAQVEPRPWVGLTDAERSSIAELYLSAPSACGLYELLLRVEAQLKVKNGGTR